MSSDFTLFIGRFHPLIVHLPIGILLFAALLELLSATRKGEGYDKATQVALLIGAFSAFLSALAGYFLSEGGGYDDDVLFWHQWLGVSIGVLALVAWWLKRSPRYNVRIVHASASQWMITLVLLVIGITGHLGGSLTHGSTYLSDYMPAPFKSWLVAENRPEQAEPLPTQIDSVKVFAQVIQPILNSKCVSCHKEGKAQGKLLLDSEAGIRKGGKSGPVITAGDWEESELVRRVMLPPTSTKFMPAKNLPPLDNLEINILKWWIANGADYQKKVAATNPDDKTKYLLTVYLGLDSDAKPVVKLPEVPAASAETLKKLKESGIMARPLSQETHLLDVSIPGARNQSTEKRHELLKQLLPIKEQVYWLNLSDGGWVSEDLKVLGQFPRLNRLYLQKNNISDNGIGYLRELKGLETLNLYGNPLTDSCIPAIQALPSLKKITLWQTQLSDKGMAGLSTQANRLEVN
jgi:uncharacterized membrane protein